MRRVVDTRRIFCSNLTLVELSMLNFPIRAIHLYALWEAQIFFHTRKAQWDFARRRFYRTQAKSGY